MFVGYFNHNRYYPKSKWVAIAQLFSLFSSKYRQRSRGRWIRFGVISIRLSGSSYSGGCIWQCFERSVGIVRTLSTRRTGRICGQDREKPPVSEFWWIRGPCSHREKDRSQCLEKRRHVVPIRGSTQYGPIWMDVLCRSIRRYLQVCVRF